MRLLTPEGLAAYCSDDWLHSFLLREACASDSMLTCQRWLMESAPKRFTTDTLYRSLLTSTGRRVLDVGGGLTTIQRRLAEYHQYDLIDILAHDSPSAVDNFLRSATSLQLHRTDWLEWKPADSYDLIVANDIFPNVDQRLHLFLEAYLPYTKEIRLSLTFYNTPRYYSTKRIDADEVLYFLAWNGEMLEMVLGRYADRIIDYRSGLCATAKESIFPNGRQVVVVTINGNR